MPFINTDTIPQNREPIKTTDIDQLFLVLPQTIPYELNVWVGGKMGQYGITTGNLIFYLEQDNEPTSEQMQYFDSLVLPLGINATASEQWKLERGQRIYDRGNKVKEYMSSTSTAPILTIDEFLLKLPNKLPFPYDIDLTGSLLKAGWSAHDGDLIIESDEVTNRQRREVAKYFTELTGWLFHVGQRCMDERGTVYKAPLYKIGIRCQ